MVQEVKISQANLLPGDCILSQGTSWISRGILFLTSWHTKEAWASHQASYLEHGRCIEAIGKARITKLKRYDNLNIILKVYRLPLTDKQRRRFVDGSYDVANKAYGYTKLPLFALDAIATKFLSFFGREDPVFFFTRRFGILSIPVCSQLFVYILYKYCDYRLYDTSYNEVNWRIVSPDYLDDLLKLPVNHATVVFSQNI